MSSLLWGGANVIDKVDGKRIGNDVNTYLVAMWKAVQAGWVPPSNISEDEYRDIKQNKDRYPPELVAFVGFGCSHSGKWFQAYAWDKTNRNYADESARNVLKQRPGIQGVVFTSVNYDEIDIPPNSIIYCDPPYANTTKYKDGLDHEKFWEWCRQKVREGHQVFVSEYSAPDDFRCVWSSKESAVLGRNTKKATERLFVWSGQ